MQRIWSGERLSDAVGPIGPAPARAGGPEILIGGRAPAAIQRLGTWGNGFISGGGGPQGANEGFRMAEKVWNEAGRAAIQAYSDIGTDELILWPTTTDLDQIDQVADMSG